MELLLFYKFSLGIAFLSGGTLPIIGHHLILRGKVLEIFALSQMALIGNLLFHSFGEVAGLLASVIFFIAGKAAIGLWRWEESFFGNAMIGLYLILLSLQHLLVGWFPWLESALRVGVFGNVVIASTGEHILLALTFLLFWIFYFLRGRDISRRSLEVSIFGTKTHQRWLDWPILFLPLIVSLYGLGLLYTLGFLLLPGILIGADFNNQKSGMKFLFGPAALSSLAGLFFSILIEKFSTTPLQIVLLFISCLGLKALFAVRKKMIT